MQYPLIKYYSIKIDVRIAFQYPFYVPVFIEDIILTSTNLLTDIVHADVKERLLATSYFCATVIHLQDDGRNTGQNMS